MKAKEQASKTATGSQYPEGTIIKNQQGIRKIMRNGQWIDYQ